MNRRRKRPNWFRIILLILLIAVGVYVDRVIIPPLGPIGVPTPTPTLPPESYVTEAEGLFEQGKLLQAIDAYKQAIASDPSNPATHVALARVQVFAGEYEDAQKSAESALLLDNNNSMAHAVLAWALDFQGSYFDAESSVKRALDLDPNNAVAHAYYAEILVDSYFSGASPFDVIEKAITHSRTAIDLAPNTLEAHRARGIVLEATQNYPEAVNEFQAAIAINGNIPDLHLLLGRNYRTLEVYDKAIEEFTRADVLNPGDPTPDLLISRTYATIGEYAKAMQYAETAVRDNPVDASLRGNLGVMYYRNLLWAESLPQFELATKGGKTDEGQEVKGLLLSNNPRIAEYYFTYGLALARTNHCGEALQLARDIQAKIPSDEIAVANAGEIIKICQQNLVSPPTPTEPVSPAPTVTPAS